MKTNLIQKIALTALALGSSSVVIAAAEEPAAATSQPAFTAVSPSSEPSAACAKTYQQVVTEVKKNPDKVLEIVSNQVKSTPKCACEIVKAALVSIKADSKNVAAIVGAAMGAAPEEHWPTIIQCSLAVAPDAFNEVNSAVIRLVGSDAALLLMPSNPLAFFRGAVGAPGGPPLIPFIPPQATEVNFTAPATVPQNSSSVNAPASKEVTP